MKILTQIYQPYQAYLLKELLESENISVMLMNENFSTLEGGFGMAVGGIQLKVNEVDFEKANALLIQFDNNSNEEE